MNVSIPDPMKNRVQDQIETGKYSNASDYVCDLIRRDQEKAEEVLRQALLEEERRGMSRRNVEDMRDLKKRRPCKG